MHCSNCPAYNISARTAQKHNFSVAVQLLFREQLRKTPFFRLLIACCCLATATIQSPISVSPPSNWSIYRIIIIIIIIIIMLKDNSYLCPIRLNMLKQVVKYSFKNPEHYSV
jgi:hypothetical protein